MTAPGTTSADASARCGSLGLLHGDLLCEAVDIHPGERILDVAAGNAAASLAAARRLADVTMVDVAGYRLDAARRVADSFDLPLTTRLAHAHDLPFDEDTFDSVLSAFGAMFAPNPQRVADELVRVCRPGGRIGMVNWAQVSLIGDVFRAASQYSPSPAACRPAIEWGSEDRLRELFGNRVRALRIETRQLVFRYRSPEHMLCWFRSWFGPTKAAFARLDADEQDQLDADLVAVYRSYNRADDGTLVAPCDYVEVVAVVR